MPKQSTNRWAIVVAALAAILLWTVLARHGRKMHGKEGFETTKKEFKLVRGPEIYDEFYVSVYDDLVYNGVKNDFEVGTIVNSTKPSQKSIILDVGSGTGHHVGEMVSRGLNATGLDLSPAMVKAARKNHPHAKYEHGNVLQANLFGPSSFTHITCLYFTLYYIKDKEQFFKNCYTWLMPGGYLVVHLVDRSTFDPVLPAGSPLAFVDPQNYADERITKTVVEFDTHSYSADFKLNEVADEGVFIETFREPGTQIIRKNTHEFHMPSQKRIIQQAREAGFILVSNTEMGACQYNSQYLYVLQKPG